MPFAALRQRGTPAADLARVLAVWLVVILLAQGWAALQTAVRGPAHRHLAVSLESQAQPSSSALASSALAHLQAHEQGVPHHHAADEVTLPADAEAALDAAAFALMASLAALAVSYAWLAG